MFTYVIVVYVVLTFLAYGWFCISKIKGRKK